MFYIKLISQFFYHQTDPIKEGENLWIKFINKIIKKIICDFFIPCSPYIKLKIENNYS